MSQTDQAVHNFVFVTTEVSYREISEIAMKHQMTVAEFVGRAILTYIKKVENLNQPAQAGQEEAR